MTILLYKNGQWLIDGEQPLEGVSLDNLAAILTNPKDGDVMKYDETSGMWVAGSSLPPVTSSDNGKVLAVVGDEWAAGTPYVLVTQENGVASLKGSEINSLAASGVEIYFNDVDGLYAYVSASGTTAVFSGVTTTLEAKKVSVNDNKGVTRSSKSVYSKPSGGIPEADLAQAVKDKLNKFIVTLTPTALDYSGTMDKTVAEINAAYEAGQEIVFRVIMSATAHMDVDCTARWFGGSTYPSFNGFILDGEIGRAHV